MWTINLIQGVFEGTDRTLLHCWKNVRVSVQGDSNGRVAEHLGNDLGVDIAREQQGGARVPEVVEAYFAQVRPLEKLCERPLPEIGGGHGRATLRGED